MARPPRPRYQGTGKPTGYVCEQCAEFRVTWRAAMNHEADNPGHTIRASYQPREGKK